MIEQAQNSPPLSGRDPRVGAVLRHTFATTAGRTAPYTIPTPLLYQDEKDFQAVLDAYQNRNHIAHNIGLIFLAPKNAQTEQERIPRWATLLTEVNADFYVPVLVDHPDTARMVAARLRNKGGLGVQHLLLQTTARGMRTYLAPITDPKKQKIIQDIQSPFL